ncbi:hypothetical protein E3P77_02873 [Wallemia ichthyophaga]|nr:hypothetical protein E3P77_02873 [Wallemia ichthyophaga]
MPYSPSHYDTLALPTTATGKDIRHAYRRQALALHPDRTGQATDASFRAVQEAYAVLSDPVLRREYDQGGKGEGVSASLTVSPSILSQLTSLALLLLVILIYQFAHLLPHLTLLLLAINARWQCRSPALPLTLLLLTCMRGWTFAVVWCACLWATPHAMVWCFWGVAYAALFNHYNAVSTLVALTWSVEHTRLGQSLINLSPLVLLLKLIKYVAF